MQNDPEMELGLWDGNQEVHLQLLRHIRKSASGIITGEKNFSHSCQGTAGEPGGRGSSDRLPEPGFMPVLGTSEGVLTAEYEPGC